MNNSNKKFMCGFGTGLLSAYLFSPVDRALYLMIKNKSGIFNKQVWCKPYSGITQVLYNKTISYGIYFPLYDTYKQYFKFNTTTSSILTGATVAILNNPINVIKIHNWNRYTSIGSFQLGKEMYKKHGMNIFMYGGSYTIFRDSLFSLVFYTLSNKYNSHKSIYNDILYASAATAITSPINYFRNRLYFDFTKPVTVKQMILEINNESKSLTCTKASKLMYILHNKFNINFGVLRVGIGIALSKKIYETTENIFVNE